MPYQLPSDSDPIWRDALTRLATTYERSNDGINLVPPARQPIPTLDELISDVNEVVAATTGMTNPIIRAIHARLLRHVTTRKHDERRRRQWCREQCGGEGRGED